MLNLFWTEGKLCVVLLPGVGKLRKDARVISAIILCRIASISWLDSLQVITWLPLSRVRSLQEIVRHTILPRSCLLFAKAKSHCSVDPTLWIQDPALSRLLLATLYYIQLKNASPSDYLAVAMRY